MNKMFPWFRKSIIDPVRPLFKLEGQVEFAYENESEYRLEDGYLYGQFSNVRGIVEAKNHYHNEQPELAAKALLNYFRGRSTPVFFLRSSEQDLLRERFEYFPNVIKATELPASQAMRHIFCPYDTEKPVALGQDIDWFYDFHSGSCPNIHVKKLLKELYSDSEKQRGGFVSFDRTWDLNQHFHFLTLARSFWLAQQDNYAAEVMIQAISWSKSNPLWIGVNWLNFDTVAVRLMNWMIAINMCLNSRVVTPVLFAEVLKTMILHASALSWHLTHDQTLSLPAASCLYMFAVNFPELKLAERWQNLAKSKLPELIKREFDSNGLHLSASLCVHCSAMEWLLLPIVQHMRTQTSPPVFLTEACIKALQALQAISGTNRVIKHISYNPFQNTDGTAKTSKPVPHPLIPNIGTYSPPGFLGRFAYSSFEYAQNLLCLGAIALNCGQWSYAIKNMPGELLWWVGPNASEMFNQIIPYAPKTNQFYFSAAGLGVVRDTWEESGSQAIIRGCQPRNYSRDFYNPPNQAASPKATHCDFLSVIVNVKGEPFLIDSGFPDYYGKTSAYLNSFFSHSTPVIKGEIRPFEVARQEDLNSSEASLCPDSIEDIDKGNRLFCSPLYRSTLGGDIIFKAKRQAKLNNGMLISIGRELLLKSNQQMLVIRDTISCGDPEVTIEFGSSLLFAPHLHFVMRSDMGCKVVGNSFSARVMPFFPKGTRHLCNKGSNTPPVPVGWYYGYKKMIPTQQIRYFSKMTLPCRTYFVIDWTGHEPEKFKMAELDSMFE